jgi:hypothetical protein
VSVLTACTLPGKEEYTSKLAHVELAKKMRQRGNNIFFVFLRILVFLPFKIRAKHLKSVIEFILLLFLELKVNHSMIERKIRFTL